MMKTLYDLLGALPHDDADGLRTAFRTAVKGAHPDINPGDPDAALKFRQIVRANEILSDDEQRAAYDHLLDLARLEQDPKPEHRKLAAISKRASGAVAGAGLSLMAIGGCLLLMQTSTASVALPSRVEIARAWSQVAALASPGPWDVNNLKPSRAKDKAETALAQADGSSTVISPADTSRASVDRGDAPHGIGVFADRFYGAGETPVFGDALFNGAIADLDQPNQPDLGLSPAYLDRKALFYRLQKFEGTFADMGQEKRAEKRVEKPSHGAPAPRIARIQRIEARARPVPPQRTAERDPSREAYPLTAMH